MQQIKLLPLSPVGLLQEHFVGNDWVVLCIGVLLNQTRREQLERVFPTFIALYNTPEKLLNAHEMDVATLCKPLGFSNRRTKVLYRLAKAYTDTAWNNARELPGIGEYGNASWEIFCKNIIPLEPPRDHALHRFVKWMNTQI